MKPAKRTAVTADPPAQPVHAVAAELGIPRSTMALLRARGQGPHCFKVGRRLYVSKRAKQEWIETLERDAAAPSKRQGVAA
jgi:hypothetical protein